MRSAIKIVSRTSGFGQPDNYKITVQFTEWPVNFQSISLWQLKNEKIVEPLDSGSQIIIKRQCNLQNGQLIFKPISLWQVKNEKIVEPLESGHQIITKLQCNLQLTPLGLFYALTVLCVFHDTDVYC